MDALKTLLEQAEADRNQALSAFNLTRARSEAARTQAGRADAVEERHERQPADA